MNSQEIKAQIEDDIEYFNDFVKHYNYQTLDTCQNCKYSDYTLKNELYCKKINEKISGWSSRVAVVDEYAKCDLHEINLARDW